MGALLFDENFGRSNIAVDEVGTFLFGDGLDWNLEFHSLDGIVNAENIVKEGHPKPLGFALLVALSGPFLDELFGGLFLVIDSAHNCSYST